MIICNKKFKEDRSFNKTLFESENFRVIPSVGAMVEGWLLLIPKNHYISFSKMNPVLLDEAEELSNHVYSILKKTYKCEVAVFENGAGDMENKIGCGVDYAHIHFVPIRINLKHVIELSYNSFFKWTECQSLTDVSDLNNNYFYIWHNGQKLVGLPPYPQSQVIRKGIAASLGIPEKFNWKTHKFDENIIKTINRIEFYKLKEYEPARV